MSSAQATERGGRLFGILCTYRRPMAAQHYLDALERQTARPDFVVIVDNSSDPNLRTAVLERAAGTLRCEYLDPTANIGPAGAFRLGFELLEKIATPDDLVAHFDDDDPPVSDTQLADLIAVLTEARKGDPTISGVGMSGGLLNRWTGTIRRSDRAARVADVDHLHGGYLPVYRFDGLSAVRSCDPSFFYGFEELELGRRLRAGGRKLVVDNATMEKLEPLYDKKSPRLTSVAQNYAADNGWSRFHKERNLIRILRREHLWSAIVFTVATRYVLKPLLTMIQSPRAGWDRLVIGLRATWAGLTDSTGTDARYPPP